MPADVSLWLAVGLILLVFACYLVQAVLCRTALARGAAFESVIRIRSVVSLKLRTATPAECLAVSGWRKMVIRGNGTARKPTKTKDLDGSGALNRAPLRSRRREPGREKPEPGSPARQ